MATRGQKIKAGEYEKKYGFELKTIRLRNNFIQQDIADDLGVTLQQYRKYESGAVKISVATEQKIANFFGMTRSELVKKIEEQIYENPKLLTTL